MNTRAQARIFFASSISTILEWYDFSLFAFMTPVFARLFYPEKNSTNAMIIGYAIFALGFFGRPLGAFIFGHFGDRFGRKKTLTWTILLMSIPTCGIGLLPTYQQVGMLAPTLLVILRILQGISAGGESTGAILFAMESHAAEHHGFIGGIMWSLAGMGLLLGSLVATFVMQFNSDWLWRVPFLLGIITGIVGYLVRTRTEESLLFKQAIKQQAIRQFPLRDALIHHKKSILTMICIYMLSAMITYLVFIFMPTYVVSVRAMSPAQAHFISTIALLCSTILVPMGGYCADSFGRKKCLLLGAAGFAVCSYILFQWTAQGSLIEFYLAQLLFLLFASCYQGAITAAVFHMVPTTLRYSIVAVSYNFSYCIFGGTAPLIASYLVSVSGNNAAPGIYLTIGAIIAFTAISRLRFDASVTQLQLTDGESAL